jgi:hypothetical protein
MTPPEPQRVGVAVVRVWVDPEGLRARITRTLDVRDGEEVVTVAATSADVLKALEAWLEEFVTAR